MSAAPNLAQFNAVRTDLIGFIGFRISLDDYQEGDLIGDIFAESDESDDAEEVSA